ncbi:MAG: hypothetical protein V1704_00290 [Candidatus Vogelbacteria bacterium]
MKKIFLLIIIFYLLVGLIYGMLGEFSLEVKYGGVWYEALFNPHAYLRALVFSPFWPNDLFWTFR